jgi:hypothetical protein
MKHIVKRLLLVIFASSAMYLVLLAYPQPLFAYELTAAGISLHSTQPIPEAMKATLERARARLDRSLSSAATRGAHVFICDSPWLFGVFARQNYRVGGVTDWLVGQHVFLRASDMDHDRLIGPSGQPVAADPRRSGLYLRYHLMVAYLIEKKRMDIGEVFAHAPARDDVEAQLAALPGW